MDTEHINVKTRTSYIGCNQGSLIHNATENNYKSNLWGTFMQWRSLDRSVSKGQKGTPVNHPATVKTHEFDKKETNIGRA